MWNLEAVFLIFRRTICELHCVEREFISADPGGYIFMKYNSYLLLIPGLLIPFLAVLFLLLFDKSPSQCQAYLRHIRGCPTCGQQKNNTCLEKRGQDEKGK